MDDLKKYLLENRKGLDAEVPEYYVWQKVNKRTKKPAPVVLIIRLAIAACILAGILMAVLYLDKRTTSPATAGLKKNDNKQELAEKQERQLVAEDTTELRADDVEGASLPINKKHSYTYRGDPSRKKAEDERELVDGGAVSYKAEFAGLVERELSVLKTLAVYTESDKYFALYKQQWKELEQRERILKNDLKSNAGDVIITALTHLYKQKLQLLSDLQFEIKDMNSKAETLGLDSNIKPYYFTL